MAVHLSDPHEGGMVLLVSKVRGCRTVGLCLVWSLWRRGPQVVGSENSKPISRTLPAVLCQHRVGPVSLCAWTMRPGSLAHCCYHASNHGYTLISGADCFACRSASWSCGRPYVFCVFPV
jgi:hypothetical protein